jgi:hypothetical protein
MIKMRMRKKDKINRRQLMKFQCGRRQSFGTDCESRQANSDPGKQDGIGEYCYAKKIDEHRGVPDPGKRHLRTIPFKGLGFIEGWSDAAPAFNRPFRAQMRKPMTHSRSAWNVSRRVHPEN